MLHPLARLEAEDGTTLTLAYGRCCGDEVARLTITHPNSEYRVTLGWSQIKATKRFLDENFHKLRSILKGDCNDV